jgi:hypothetical protein
MIYLIINLFFLFVIIVSIIEKKKFKRKSTRSNGGFHSKWLLCFGCLERKFVTAILLRKKKPHSQNDNSRFTMNRSNFLRSSTKWFLNPRRMKNRNKTAIRRVVCKRPSWIHLNSWWTSFIKSSGGKQTHIASYLVIPYSSTEKSESVFTTGISDV